jgi:hypothetical protein
MGPFPTKTSFGFQIFISNFSETCPKLVTKTGNHLLKNSEK